jgi:hypothetical protein
LTVVGALHQYHTCLILITEGYGAPETYYLDRIWKCLDFVFDMPADLDERTKARMILTEVAQKTEAYANLRKIRTPKGFDGNLPQTGENQRSSSGSAQQSVSPETSPPALSNATPPIIQPELNNVLQPGSVEYRYISPSAADVYYATQQNITAHASPAYSSDTGSIGTGGGTMMKPDAGAGDLMLDVDWVNDFNAIWNIVVVDLLL